MWTYLQTCAYIHRSVYAHVFSSIVSGEGLEATTLVAASTPGTRCGLLILLSREGPRAPGERADSGPRTGNMQDERGTSCGARK